MPWKSSPESIRRLLLEDRRVRPAGELRVREVDPRVEDRERLARARRNRRVGADERPPVLDRLERLGEQLDRLVRLDERARSPRAHERAEPVAPGTRQIRQRRVRAARRSRRDVAPRSSRTSAESPAARRRADRAWRVARAACAASASGAATSASDCEGDGAPDQDTDRTRTALTSPECNVRTSGSAPTSATERRPCGPRSPPSTGCRACGSSPSRRSARRTRSATSTSRASSTRRPRVETELDPREPARRACSRSSARSAGRARGLASARGRSTSTCSLYGESRIHEPGLRVPHPRLHERALRARAARRAGPGHSSCLDRARWRPCSRNLESR